ncbi:MAG: DNA repair protein RecO [Anaerolineaceae bacterium 4572_5.2]|nr:MAG: DNA repair protein RecO [Anaerolineaceae bacterium 4572_5.2]
MPERHRTIRTEGVILRRKNFGETDRLLTVFTRKLGRINVIAKGVRKPTSRKTGHVEPFMRSTLLIAKGRNLYILTQAETIDAYIPLREDLTGIGYGAYVVELLDAFVYEEGSHLTLYKLLTSTLERLSRGDAPEIVLRYYELRLLEEVGFRPELFHCVECGKEIQEQNQYFSGKLGGVVCPSCGEMERGNHLWRVSARALKYLRHFQRNRYPDVKDISVPASLVPEIKGAMRYYVVYTLERNLNSPDFIELMERLNGKGTEHG